MKTVIKTRILGTCSWCEACNLLFFQKVK